MIEFSLRELECFLAVAEELSFTRAAERLHLAQPPLSRHIRNLEEKIGVALFIRTKRSVELTPAGVAFRSEAKEIRIGVRRASDAARRAAEGETERLEIGFVSAVLSPELVELFSLFRREHPKVRVNLHDRLPTEQIDALANREFDIGFIGIAPKKLPGGIVLSEWMKEPLMAFLPPDHPLSSSSSVRITDLADEPFVMISNEAAPAYSAHVRNLCHEAGFSPRVVQEARRAQAVAAMTVAGSGVAILPASLHRFTRNGIPLRLSRNRKPQITYVAASHNRISSTAAAFLELLK